MNGCYVCDRPGVDVHYRGFTVKLCARHVPKTAEPVCTAPADAAYGCWPPCPIHKCSVEVGCLCHMKEYQ